MSWTNDVVMAILRCVDALADEAGRAKGCRSARPSGSRRRRGESTLTRFGGEDPEAVDIFDEALQGRRAEGAGEILLGWEIRSGSGAAASQRDEEDRIYACLAIDARAPYKVEALTGKGRISREVRPCFV